jgi:hypothetical protein
MTGSIMSAIPMGKAGVGSAMNDTTRELGGALGVAVLGSLVAGYILLPKSRDPDPERLDPIGALLSIAGLGGLVYAIIEAPHRGWASDKSLMWFGASIVLVIAFLAWELHNPTPMLNLRYFLDPRFGVAAGVITLVFFAMFGFFFLLTQYFQLVLGYGTLEAGVKQLPFAAIMMSVAPQGPKLAARFGVNRVVAAGLVGLSSGMFLFMIAEINTSYWAVLPTMGMMAGGMAITMPAMTGSIMSAIPLGKAGVGSAMNDTTRELGGALGVAVMGSLVASRYDTKLSSALDLLPASLRVQAGESLAGALQAAHDSSVESSTGAQVATMARQAYVSGLHLAAFIGGCVSLVAAVIVYRKLPATNPHAHAAISVRPEARLAVEPGSLA